MAAIGTVIENRLLVYTRRVNEFNVLENRRSKLLVSLLRTQYFLVNKKQRNAKEIGTKKEGT